MEAAYGSSKIYKGRAREKMKFKAIILFFFLFLLPASCHPVRYDGPYKGRVVDADTRQPIEGVVVLGVWYKEIATPAGGVGSYYDATETVSDKNGEFEIQGLGLKILSNVEPVDVQIFKAGYEYIGLLPWDSFKEDGILKKKIKWEGSKAIIPLKKLTMEQRRKEGISPPLPPGEASVEKVRRMLKEINKDAMERGADIIDTWRGGDVYEKNEIR